MREGISVISPMWGTREVTDRMVFSVLHQFISPSNPFKIELVLVDDYIEGRKEDGGSYYDFYLSDELKSFYDTEHISIKIIKNEQHEYQGHSREIGFMAATYPMFLLLDCDDMLAPNACDRYLSLLEDYEDDENNQGKIACIHGLLYSFDTKCGGSNIVGHSIWVQGRCYNRDFIVKHDIHFPTGTNSRQGEDYPFIRKLDYAIQHDEEYNVLQLPYGQGEDCQCTAYWFPNENSLSRKDPYYSQHLAGWTMASSNSILNYFDDFNKKNGFEDKQDEFMKTEYLNMNIYAFYNLLDFIKTVASTDYKPIEEDWYALRDNVRDLRKRLYNKYWAEIVNSDVEDMLYNVKHFSDVHFCECWFGTFYDYMETEHEILRMSYDEMIKYAEGLEFDAVGHEVHSRQVKAWVARHPQKEVKNE